MSQLTQMNQIPQANNQNEPNPPETETHDEQNPPRSESSKTESNIKNKELIPTWSATHSLLADKEPCKSLTNCAVVSLLFRQSPTDLGTLFTILKLTQGINAFVLGKDRKTIMELDMDLANRAYKLRESIGLNNNWVIRVRDIHMCFSALHGIGKTMEGSGFETCAIDCGAYSAVIYYQY